jgi:hypothetical protein
MRVKLTCEVAGHTRIADDISVRRNGREYIFRRNEGGYIAAVEVIDEVTRPEEFYGSGMQMDGKTVVLRHAYDVAQNDSLIRDLQELESLMAYEHHLYRIKWDWPTRELLDVAAEDARQIGLPRFSWPGPKPASKTVGRAELESVIEQLGRYSDLTVLISFFREGKYDFMNSRNINAFHNFYFVLEGLYGNGKSKNDHVMREFLTNSEAVAAFTWGVGQMKAERKANFAKIIKHLQERNLPTTIESLIRRTVLMRGSLHHYNAKSSIPQGTPFNHRDYEPWAEYLLLTCIGAIEGEKRKRDQIGIALAHRFEVAPGETQAPEAPHEAGRIHEEVLSESASEAIGYGTTNHDLEGEKQ